MGKEIRQIYGEEEMRAFGAEVAQNLARPVVLELVGDVGAGKTTFTQGLAHELGVQEPLTSPSFTISKRYALPDGGELVHYDFYRLADPGIMRDELAETLANPANVVVIEWGGEVAELLPKNRLRLVLALTDDGSRRVEVDD